MLPSVGVLKPGSRRTVLYLWFLETRPRSRELRPQTCSSWLTRCNELGASAAAVHSGLSCRCSCAGAPRPRRTSAIVPRHVLGARGSTRATCGCIADAHSTRCSAVLDTVTNGPGTACSSVLRNTKLRACVQLRCIMCAPWMYRASVREVFVERWVTLLHVLRARPCMYTPYGRP